MKIAFFSFKTLALGGGKKRDPGNEVAGENESRQLSVPTSYKKLKKIKNILFIFFFLYFAGDKRISPHAPAGNYYKKFKRLPKVSKILIITSVFAFLILVFLATLYYCKRKKATTADQVKGKPQSYDEAKAPSTKTNVPMRPLINEV